MIDREKCINEIRREENLLKFFAYVERVEEGIMVTSMYQVSVKDNRGKESEEMK